MPYAHWKMACHTCSNPIDIPVPTPKQLSANPGVWPRETWSTKFLCLPCGHVDIYSASRKDVQFEFQPVPSPYKLGGYRCYLIQFACGEENCGSPVEAYTTAVGSTAIEAIADIFPRLAFRYDCPSGKPHQPKLPADLGAVRIQECEFPW
jgi:hypothetical protein